MTSPSQSVTPRNPVLAADPSISPVDRTVRQLCPPVGGPVLIVNPDLTATIYAGYSLGIGPSNAVAVPPLGSAVLDGTKTIYAFCPSAVVLAQVIPGATAWSASPAQIAAQIAISGVPLLSRSTLTTSVPATALGAAGSTVLGPFTINQIGYELQVTASIPGGGTVPYLEAQMVWSDSATGLTVAQENWWLGAATAPNAQVYPGTGPTKGDTLTVTLINQDPGQAITYSFTLAQNSRSYARDDWRQSSRFANPVIALPASDAPGNFLFVTNPSIAAAAQQARIIPLYAGRISVLVSTGAGTAVVSILATADQAVAGTGVTIAQWSVPANGSVITDVSLPRAVCAVNLTNSGGSTQNIYAAGVIAEYGP